MLGLSNYFFFFFWKTRVIKLLIIYLILKILIYRRVWCCTVTSRIAPCGVVQCGLSLAKTITAPHRIFAVTYAVRYIRCSLNDLKLVYFSNFGLFLPSSKLIFPFVLVQVLNYWASFSLFWVGFLNQTILGCYDYQNFFFFFWEN